MQLHRTWIIFLIFELCDLNGSLQIFAMDTSLTSRGSAGTSPSSVQMAFASDGCSDSSGQFVTSVSNLSLHDKHAGLIKELYAHFTDPKFCFSTFRQPSVSDVRRALFNSLKFPLKCHSLHRTDWDLEHEKYAQEFKAMPNDQDRWIVADCLTRLFKEEAAEFMAWRVSLAQKGTRKKVTFDDVVVHYQFNQDESFRVFHEPC